MGAHTEQKHERAHTLTWTEIPASGNSMRHTPICAAVSPVCSRNTVKKGEYADRALNSARYMSFADHRGTGGGSLSTLGLQGCMGSEATEPLSPGAGGEVKVQHRIANKRLEGGVLPRAMGGTMDPPA